MLASCQAWLSAESIESGATGRYVEEGRLELLRLPLSFRRSSQASVRRRGGIRIASHFHVVALVIASLTRARSPSTSDF
jgi:hypothetical protein